MNNSRRQTIIEFLKKLIMATRKISERLRIEYDLQEELNKSNHRTLAERRYLEFASKVVDKR